MRRLYATAAMILAAASLGFAQAKPGPLPDRIIFDTRMQEDIGLRDAAEGKTDFFFQNITGPTLKALPAEVRAKLDSYAVPESSWSLQLNPFPNKAPYQGKVDGKAVFNPFAIREIRYAINWLVDRKRIVDEVLDGEGGPMFTPMTPGQPGTYKFNLVASKLGMTARGNEKKAIADIEAAMKAAAELPENRGKLAKSGQFWTFEGQPVAIRFMIRVDDPNGRLRVGRYIADQLEKAGIKVERLEWDRAKCFDFLDDDPAKLGWSMYTEGWGAGATRAYWDISVSQMYAPYYGQLPGGNREGFWSFEHKEIDDLAQKCINGQFLDAAEYWKDNLRAVELGLKDSVRINLTYSLSYFTVNKARFNARFPYGLGDGPNRWSTIGADVKPDAKGERTLRTTLFSARGALFMSAWDPVGPGGFSDTYIRAIVDPVTDPANFEAPNSALDTPLNVTWNEKDIVSKVARAADGGLAGEVAIPADAMVYDSASKTWKSLPAGSKSFSKATFTLVPHKWHHGLPVGVEDYLYASAFQREWATEDGKGDKYFDQMYSENIVSQLKSLRALQLNKDGTITSYVDINWPLDKNRVAGQGTPALYTNNGQSKVCVPWEINEALAKLVAEGAKSGAPYSFSDDPNLVEVDCVAPANVADIRAKLEEMAAAKHVPASIKKWVTPEQAVARYRASIKFIDSYKHAYISNGPYYIAAYDPATNYLELKAFRDSYPFKGDYWNKRFQTTLSRIDDVVLPQSAKRDADLLVAAKVSAVVYPLDTASAADGRFKATVTLISPDGVEKSYQAAFTKAGEFAAKIPAKDLAAGKSGAWTVIVETRLGAEAPSVEVRSLILL